MCATHIPGTRQHAQFDYIFDGERKRLPKLAAQFICELHSASVLNDDGWLDSVDSFSCYFKKDGKSVASDPHTRARQFVLTLRAILGDVIESGLGRYRLYKFVLFPTIDNRTYTAPLNPKVLEKLRKASLHGD